MTKAAAKKIFEQTGYTPNDVDVVELHDCFSANELITYEALGLCPEGRALICVYLSHDLDFVTFLNECRVVI